MKKTVGIFAFMAIVLFTSCLKGDNISVFNGMIGTFETVQISGSSTELMLRLDADGSLIKIPSTTQDYRIGDRAIAGFKLDYDNQSAEALKNGYFEVTNIILEKVETLFSTDPDSQEILPKDPIQVINTGYMIQTIGEPKRYLFTLSGFYKSAVSATHKFQLYRKPFKAGVENDTLKYELRHDKMNDVENQLNKQFIYSFDCSYEMTSLKASEKKLVIQLIYWDMLGNEIKEHLTYTYPKY